MNKTLCSVLVAVMLFALPAQLFSQESVSEQSLQESSQDSLQQSSEDSLEQSTDESSQQTTEESSQQTTQQSSDQTTEQSTQQSSDNSSQQTTGASSEATTQASADSSAQSGDASLVVMVVAGTTVAVGLTAAGLTYIVRVSGAEQENVLALQDEIYAADGVEYSRLVNGLGVDEIVVIAANDEVVAAGYLIESDQDAADYLVELILRIAERAGPLEMSAARS